MVTETIPTYMYGSEVFDDLVTIPANEYQELLEDSKVLAVLVQAGVDNWSGYDFAMELLNDPE